MARHFVAASTDYIDCGSGVRGSDVVSLTVAAWIKLDSHTAERKVMARWNNTAAESWLLTVGSDGKVSFVILATDNNAYSTTSATALSDGVWYHIGGTYDTATLKVFVNGAVDGSNTINKTMKTGTLPLLIGKGGDGNPFDGSIAEATVWFNSYPAIVTALAQGASPSDCEGMASTDHIGYWPLLGLSPEADVAANNHPGTLHGTTVVDHPGVRSVTAFL